jgi:hypothetical protein
MRNSLDHLLCFQQLALGHSIAPRDVMFPPSILRTLLVLVALMATTVTVASADTYHSASFTGNFNPGSANVKAPFSSVITQGGPISGSFVYDDQLIPGPNSGFVNVFFSAFPDIASIPPANAFNIDLGGGLTFDLSSALGGSAAIQYKDGAFNGFFFVSDFIFQNNPYELNMQGGTFTIKLLGANGFVTGSSLVNGHLDIGNNNLSDVATFTPGSTTTPVPEPGSMILLGSGLIGVAGAVRRKLLA